jgi:hypothetical protein
MGNSRQRSRALTLRRRQVSTPCPIYDEWVIGGVDFDCRWWGVVFVD